MIWAMQLPGRAAIILGVFFGLVAGCRRSSAGGTGAGGQGGGSADAGGAGQDAQAPTCGETIDQYCRSDGSTCLAGVARDWTTAKQQASSHCGASGRVFFQQCTTDGDAGNGTKYGVLNVGSVDDDTVLFYDLTTLQLVRVDHIQFGGSTNCIAGVDLASVDCSMDGGAPTYVCTASDAGTTSDAGAASDAGTASDAAAD
jgi:hypothetical protein